MRGSDIDLLPERAAFLSVYDGARSLALLKDGRAPALTQGIVVCDWRLMRPVRDCVSRTKT